MGPKKRVNRTDLTLRNLHALKKALKKLKDQVESLEAHFESLTLAFEILDTRVQNHEYIHHQSPKPRSNKGK